VGTRSGTASTRDSVISQLHRCAPPPGANLDWSLQVLSSGPPMKFVSNPGQRWSNCIHQGFPFNSFCTFLSEGRPLRSSLLEHATNLLDPLRGQGTEITPQRSNELPSNDWEQSTHHHHVPRDNDSIRVIFVDAFVVRFGVGALSHGDQQTDQEPAARW
jgi:hypothetical protein